MKRMLALMLALPMLAVLTLAGCGGADKKTTPPEKKTTKTGDGKDDTGGKGKAAGAAIKPGTAKVTGRVVYDGAAPKMSFVADMEKHADAKTCCLKGSETEKNEQTWILGKDKGVANVVVWLAAPKGSKFEVAQSGGAVVIDQPHCAYIPHVAVVKPGQELLVKNSADCAHNTKWEGDPTINPAGGQTLPPKTKDPLKIQLKPQADPISLRCDFHKWMEAKVFVSEHQYIAVTDENGNFTIENVPADAELRVVMWHEGAGYFHGGKQGTPLKADKTDLGDVKVTAK